MSELKPLEDIAKQIANMVGMPYCWEDIASRLADGKPLPFKLGDSWNTRPDLKFRLGAIAGKIDRAFDLINEGSLDEAKAALCRAGEIINTIMGEQE